MDVMLRAGDDEAVVTHVNRFSTLLLITFQRRHVNIVSGKEPITVAFVSSRRSKRVRLFSFTIFATLDGYRLS